MRASAKLLPVSRLLTLAPPLAVLVLILSFANEVPYWDEWDTPGAMLEKITRGKMSWEHLFRQHNESRKAVPQAVFALGTLLFGWRVIPYMVLGWLCALATLVLLLKMLAVDRREETGWMPLAGLLVAFLLFSPIQAENQLWGIQMIVFIPPLCLVASLWVQSTRISYRYVVLLCALFSLIAMFSFANGMLCWVLAFPLVRYWLSEGQSIPAERRKSVVAWTAVYLALAAASIGAYFWDYHRPSHHPSLSVVLEDPALGVSFLTAWLGSPFLAAPGGNPGSASSLGTVLFLTLSLVSVWVVRESGSRSPRRFWLPYYPWICITTYGIISGLVTTAGRAGFGLEQAMSGRYSTFALWVVIGLVGMVTVLWRSQAGRRLNSSHLLCLLVSGALCYLTLVSWTAGTARFEEAGHRSSQHLLTLRLLKVAPTNPLIGCPGPECLYPRARKVLRRVAVLDEAGVLTVDFIGSWLPAELSAPAGADSGEFRITSEGENRIRIVGWAALPGEHRAPDFVALARPGRAGRLELVSGLIVKDHLHRWATPKASTEKHRSFFGETLAIPFYEARDLRVFAVDLSSEKVHGLAQRG